MSTDGTDETRPLPAADETPTRAIEPVPADDATTTDLPVVDEQEEPPEPTRPLPTTPPEPAPEPVGRPGPDTVAGPGSAPRASGDPASPLTGTAPGSTGTAAPAAAAAPAPAPAPATPAGPELRVGTVVWGLVVAVVGIGIISFAWGARIDGGLALIVLLAGAGVALLVGSLVVALRRPNRRGGRG